MLAKPHRLHLQRSKKHAFNSLYGDGAGFMGLGPFMVHE